MINVNKLKSSLTPTQIIDILLSLGADCKKESDKELVFSSICCKENANERSPKLYYYISTQNFVCYRCNFSGDVIALVREIKHLPFIDALCWICDTIGVDPDVFGRKSIKQIDDWQHRLKKYLTRQSSDVELQVYDDKILNFFPKEYHQSWIDDGISIETMQKYEIAYYPYHNSIVIPCRDESDNLIGIRERFLRPEDCERGKYRPLLMLDDKYHFKFPTNKVFYGIGNNMEAIKRRQVVWLCEGEKSVLKADTFYGDDSVALALYGSNLGKYRRDYLVSLGVKEVVICLDSDFHEIGDNEEYNLFEKKVFKMAQQLKGFFKISVCYNNAGLDGYKCSPFDWDKETFEMLYDNREVIE